MSKTALRLLPENENEEGSFFEKLFGFRSFKENDRSQILTDGDFLDTTAGANQITGNEEKFFLDSVIGTSKEDVQSEVATDTGLVAGTNKELAFTETLFGRAEDETSSEMANLISPHTHESGYVRFLFSKIVPKYETTLKEFVKEQRYDDFDVTERRIQELNCAVVLVPIFALLTTLALYITGLILVRYGFPLIRRFALWYVQKYKVDDIDEEQELLQLEIRARENCVAQQKLFVANLRERLDCIKANYFEGLDFSTGNCCELSVRAQLLLCPVKKERSKNEEELGDHRMRHEVDELD